MANLTAVTHQQARLDYFRDQLAAAERRFNWYLRNRHDPWDNAEKAEVVVFYQWAVEMAERDIVHCRDCKHYYNADAQDMSVFCHHIQSDIVLAVIEDNADRIKEILEDEE